MTLTNGTTVAATTAESAMLGQLLGFPVQYGRAVVLGTTAIPAPVREQIVADGDNPDAYHAYVIEPRRSDGEPVGPDDVDEGLDPDDLAYVALGRDDGPMPMSPIGPLNSVILAERISKSEFLAATEAQQTSIVDQFRAELEDDLFLLASDVDDDDAPDFLD